MVNFSKKSNHKFFGYEDHDKAHRQLGWVDYLKSEYTPLFHIQAFQQAVFHEFCF